MKTLTHNPETNINDPKDETRRKYQRQDRKQDHGDRGTVDTDRADWKHYVASEEAERERHLSKLVMSEQLEELATMSPAQISRAADQILRASGFEINEALAENAVRDAEDAAVREALELDSDEFDIDATEEYLTNQALLRAEIQGALNSGTAVKADAQYLYEGRVDEGHADYISGFHITDRP